MAGWSSDATDQWEAYGLPADDTNAYFISLDDIDATKAKIEQAGDQNEARKRLVTVATLKDYTVFEVTLNDDLIVSVDCHSTSSVRLGPGDAGWER